MNTRKKIIEDFINRTLGDNAVRAGQKLPPLTFKEVEDPAKEVMERKADYNRVQHKRSSNEQKTAAKPEPKEINREEQ